jgi:hypothetical protein
MVVIKMSRYQWENIPEIPDATIEPGSRLSRALSRFSSVYPRILLNSPVALGPGVYSASNRNEYQKR